MLPSMWASPGHREHPLTCAQPEHSGRSRVRIDRTSANWGECFQMSIKRCLRTLPLGKGTARRANWTARIKVSVQRDVAGAVAGIVCTARPVAGDDLDAVRAAPGKGFRAR